MLIKLLSDLHIEGEPTYRPPIDAADASTVLILAGDICEIHHMNILLSFLTDMSSRFLKVMYVMGNHEYYRGHLQFSLEKLRTNTSQLTNLYILDNEHHIHDGVKFIGSTCWTSLRDACPYEMNLAGTHMNDYKHIRTGEYQRIAPIHTVRLHETSRKYIEAELANSNCAQNVVITHHAPCHLSISPYYRQNSNLNHAYYTDLTDIMDKYNPTLWVHGHVHGSFNYEVYNTQIATNPRGYCRTGYVPENSSFDEAQRFELKSLTDE